MSSKSRSHSLYSVVLSAMFLALALVLPLLTGQIREIGNMLCPMHLPVLLCGFFCGPGWGAAVGFAAPLLRFAIFGMPQLLSAAAMCPELAVYGAVAGLLYRVLPDKKWSIYLALAAAMAAGRLAWGGANLVLLGLGRLEFGWAAFVAGAFTNALPGILLQLILIPILVMALKGRAPGPGT